jgi:hypothetical protein
MDGKFWALGSEFLPVNKALKVMQKHLLDTKHLRRVPAQFSWVDHRLIRERRLSGVPPSGWALYLFLLTVGDEQGLSYYSDTSICGHLNVVPQELRLARGSLLAAALIAWEAPLYQVLELSKVPAKPATGHNGGTARAATPNRAPQQAAAVSVEEGRAESLCLAQTLSELLKGGVQ